MLLAGALHAAQAAHAAPGTTLGPIDLLTPQGERTSALQPARVNVLVFFRTGQDRSLAGLRELAQCQPQFAASPVRWSAIAPGSADPASAAQVLREAGFAGALLFDAGDRLYGQLGMAMHPVAVVVDGNRRIAAFEPLRSLEFCAAVAAGIRTALGEAAAQAPVAAAPASAASAQAARSYRALARALAARGKCEEAVRAFERALALDAQDDGAREALSACAPAR
jgi:hypothetical protein